MGRSTRLPGKVDFLFRFAVLGAAHLLAGLAAFAVMVVVSRGFGVEAVGLVLLATSLNAYAMIMATLGVETHAVVELASRRAEPRQLIADVLAVRLTASVAAHALLIVVALLLPASRSHLGFFAVYGCVLYLYALRLSWVYQAWGQTHAVAALELALQVAALALTLALAYFWPNLMAVAVARLAAELAITAALFRSLVPRLGGLPRPSGPRALLAMVHESIHLSGVQLVRGLAFASDAVILAALAPVVTSEQLGQYGAAFRVFTAAAVVINAYFILLLPRVAAEAVRGWRSVRKVTLSASVLFAALSLLGVLPIAMFADEIARTLFGESFDQTGPILRVLIVAYPFVALRQHLRAALVVTKRRRLDLALALIGTLLHVVLKLAAAATIGYESLAWVWLIVEAASAAVLAAYLAVSPDNDSHEAAATDPAADAALAGDIQSAAQLDPSSAE